MLGCSISWRFVMCPSDAVAGMRLTVAMEQCFCTQYAVRSAPYPKDQKCAALRSCQSKVQRMIASRMRRSARI